MATINCSRQIICVIKRKLYTNVCYQTAKSKSSVKKKTRSNISKKENTPIITSKLSIQKPSSNVEQVDKTNSSSNPNSNLNTVDGNLKSICTYPLYVHTFEDDEKLHNENAWEFAPLVQKLISESPKVPSVSTILNATMSEQSRLTLERWQAKKIEELGVEGFNFYKQELFANGTNFHTCIADYLAHGVADGDLPLRKGNLPLWESVQPVFEHITDVRLVETAVQHPLLGYMGIFDCLARYRNQLVVIDWKTSEKVKSQLKYTYDNPLQLVAYLGALNHDPAFDVKVKGALLVVAYKNGRQAHVHQIPPEVCNKYWADWLHRLGLYWSMRLRNESPPKVP